MKIINYIYIIGLLAALMGCSKDDKDGSKNYNFSHWEPGMVITDAEGYTEVVIGDYPLVLGVPHGGDLMPEHILDRECEGATVTKDTWTLELARAIQDEYRENYGKTPSVVICHLHRLKIDQNRVLEEALCDNVELTDTWHFYHNYLDSLLQYSSQLFNKTLFIDLHAHGHAVQRLELGHSLTIPELGYIFDGLEYPPNIPNYLGDLREKSSYRNLLNMDPSLTLNKTLMGDHAFGTLMTERGFPSVPSKQDPYPMSGQQYFTGGFNTTFATSETYPKVYGFQIEADRDSKNTETRRADFAKSLTESVEIMLANF